MEAPPLPRRDKTPCREGGQRDPAVFEALLAGTGLTPEFVETLLRLE